MHQTLLSRHFREELETMGEGICPGRVLVSCLVTWWEFMSLSASWILKECSLGEFANSQSLDTYLLAPDTWVCARLVSKHYCTGLYNSLQDLSLSPWSYTGHNCSLELSSDLLKMVRCMPTESMSEGMNRKKILCKLASVWEGQVRFWGRCLWKGVLEKAWQGKGKILPLLTPGWSPLSEGRYTWKMMD